MEDYAEQDEAVLGYYPDRRLRLGRRGAVEDCRGDRSPAMQREIEVLSVEMRESFPSHEEVVFDDFSATCWMGGSNGFSSSDPADFMIAVCDLVETLRGRGGAAATMLRRRPRGCFDSQDEIVAVDMSALIGTSEDFHK